MSRETIRLLAAIAAVVAAAGVRAMLSSPAPRRASNDPEKRGDRGMSNERPKLLIAAVSLALAILGFVVGLWQFQEEGERNRTAADLRNEQEFLRSIWLQQYETYRAISVAVGDLIAAIEFGDEQLQRDAEHRFMALYWGPAIGAEDAEIEPEMIRFLQLISLHRERLMTDDQLKKAAKTLSDRLKRSTLCGERADELGITLASCERPRP